MPALLNARLEAVVVRCPMPCALLGADLGLVVALSDFVRKFWRKGGTGCLGSGVGLARGLPLFFPPFRHKSLLRRGPVFIRVPIELQIGNCCISNQ